MAFARTEIAVLLVTYAAASLSDTVVKVAGVYDPAATATFGPSALDAANRVRGELRFSLGSYNGYQTVNWTTTGITIPSGLLDTVCGPSAGGQTFAYSINEKWLHNATTPSAQGADMCSEAFTGRRWDPSAACGPQSGNEACMACAIQQGYGCMHGAFDPTPDAAGSYAYRFLNKNACELGDLSGMHGELQVDTRSECFDQGAQCAAWAARGECKLNPDYMLVQCQKSCNACTGSAGNGFVTLRSLTNQTGGAAQMSTPFGVISRTSVVGDVIGLNCDASGPPAVHGTDCKCLEYNGKKSPSIGSMTVFRPADHQTFYLAGTGLKELTGRSVVVQCGLSFGPAYGRPLFCAQLQ